MKKAKRTMRPDLKPEYEFATMGPGTRGKYAKRFRRGTNLALLDPDVSRAFRTSEEVNAALRGLLRVAKAAAKPAARKRAKPRS